MVQNVGGEEFSLEVETQDIPDFKEAAKETTSKYGRFVAFSFLLSTGMGLALVNAALNAGRTGPVPMDHSIFVMTSVLIGGAAAFLMIWQIGRKLMVAPYVDLQRNEDRLRQSEAHASKLALVAENTSDSVIIYDRDGVILWVNNAFVRTTGYDVSDALGKRPVELLSQNQADPLVGRKINDAMKRGEAISATLMNRDKFGRDHLMEISMSPVHDQDGALTNFVSVERDITDRHLAERRLREAIDMIEDGFALFDADDRLVMFNRAYEALYDAKLTPGMSIVDLTNVLTEAGAISIEGNTPEEKAQKFSDKIRGDDYRKLIDLPDGKTMLFKSRTLESGEIVTTRTDVTELRQARRDAEASLESKSRFLANITHEVRTPLNGVIAMAELLQEDDLNEAQRSGLELISHSGTALLTIINDLLDFSKIEAGKLHIQPAPFDIVEAVEDVCALLTPEAERRDLDLSYRFSPDAPRAVMGDAGRIRQIATNLIGNALKFTEFGGVTVELDVVLEGDDLRVSLSVKDTGVGVSPDGLEAIFRPFEQADSASALKKQEGTGLGLSICRQLAVMMGGELSATSELGVGSTFRLDLRTSAADAPHDRGEPPFAAGDAVALYGASPQVEAIEAQIRSLGAEVKCGSMQPRLSVISLLNNGAAPAGLIHAADTPAIIIAPPHATPPNSVSDRFGGRIRVLRRPVRTSLLAATARDLLGVSSIQAYQGRERRSWTRAIDLPLIIAAEDNKTNAAILRAMLAKSPVRLEIFATAHDVIQAYEMRRPDLVLMDLHLPDMSGLEAVRRIRAIEEMEDRNPIPILAITASAEEEVRDDCTIAGIDDFIGKPFDKAKMRATITSWLGSEEALSKAS